MGSVLQRYCRGFVLQAARVDKLTNGLLERAVYLERLLFCWAMHCGAMPFENGYAANSAVQAVPLSYGVRK